jgi:hypothetical protein
MRRNHRCPSKASSNSSADNSHAAVAAVPVSSPDNGECVPRLNHPRNRSPASLRNPDLIAAIP